ncbi:TMEM175 family protein [Acidimangrovimonas sediminis]|uniref:TMEM175 family protein n=1 Tax=Acidimangrovimonas sediminis TaxID=2056283 RepID=UPI000C80DE56|nr:TMEM175 family protein [Acidimangrovimonas sediminis]
MKKTRVEAFSDGVLAIIITIMVLELKVPEGEDLSALAPLWPVFLAYVLSFAHIGIYWNNHHNMFHRVERVSGRVLWANLHLLFWLSLMPFATGFMGENHFAAWPVAVYIFDLFMCGAAYGVLERLLVAEHAHDSVFAMSAGRSGKEVVSVLVYLVALPVAFVSGYAALIGVVVVAALWLVPDRRFERGPGR